MAACFIQKDPPELSISHAAAFHGSKVGFDMGYKYIHIYIFSIFIFQLSLFSCN